MSSEKNPRDPACRGGLKTLPPILKGHHARHDRDAAILPRSPSSPTASPRRFALAFTLAGELESRRRRAASSRLASSWPASGCEMIAKVRRLWWSVAGHGGTVGEESGGLRGCSPSREASATTQNLHSISLHGRRLWKRHRFDSHAALPHINAHGGSFPHRSFSGAPRSSWMPRLFSRFSASLEADPLQGDVVPGLRGRSQDEGSPFRVGASAGGECGSSTSTITRVTWSFS